MKIIKSKNIILIILVTIILFSSVIVIKKLQIINSFDKFISWNFNSIDSIFNEKSDNKKNPIKKYIFDIKHNDSDIKSINLCETINKKTLMNEKIAPGTSGSFNMVLKSNQDLVYKIDFKSHNKKPHNLKFKVFLDDELIRNANEIDDCSVVGGIYKDKDVKMKVKWYWNFESEGNQEQDTEDAKNIGIFKFDVNAIGLEKI